MIYVFEEGNVVYDGSTISDVQKEQAVVVESLPIPDVIAGKQAHIKANKATETVFYKYVDIVTIEDIQQPTIEEQLAQLQSGNLILMDVIATMYEDMLEKGTV